MTGREVTPPRHPFEDIAMSLATLVDSPSRPPRRPRTGRRPVEKSKDTKKLGVLLSTDAYVRIGVASSMTGRSQGELIEELINTHLGKFIFYVKAEKEESAPSAQLNQSAG